MDEFSAILLAVFVVLLLFFCLIALGVMREVVFLRERMTVVMNLLFDPPKPSFINAPVPALLGRYVVEAIPPDQPKCVIIFARAGCNGCKRLLSRLQGLIAGGEFSPRGVICVLGDGSAGQPIVSEAQSVAQLVVHDDSRQLFAVGEVSTTPTIMSVDRRTLTVVDVSNGGDVQWLRRQLQAPIPVEAAQPA
jgi:hypothetical protein